MRDVNWNALFAFWVVAQHGSFAEAARVLPRGSAQSLHKRVRELEREQNLALKLVRSRGMKGLELTEAGRRVFEFVDPFFQGMDGLIAGMQNDDAGLLSVGMSPFGPESSGFRILRAFRRAFPKVAVTVRNGLSSEVIEMVMSGELDIGICAVTEEREGLVLTGRVPVLSQLVVPGDEPEPAGFRSWEELLDHPLVLPCRGSAPRQNLERLLARRSLSRKLWVAAEVASTQQVVEAVRSGLGVGFAPIPPQSRHRWRGVLMLNPPEGLPPLTIAVVHKQRAHLPAYMQALLHFAGAVLVPRAPSHFAPILEQGSFANPPALERTRAESR